MANLQLMALGEKAIGEVEKKREGRRIAVARLDTREFKDRSELPEDHPQLSSLDNIANDHELISLLEMLRTDHEPLPATPSGSSISNPYLGLGRRLRSLLVRTVNSA